MSRHRDEPFFSNLDWDSLQNSRSRKMKQSAIFMEDLVIKLCTTMEIKVVDGVMADPCLPFPNFFN